jgi:hypothetical protein
MRHALFGPEHAEVGEALHEAGGILLRGNKLDEAETFLSQALDMRQKLMGPDDFQVGRTLVSLGVLRCRQGRHAVDEFLLGSTTRMVISEGAADVLIASRRSG